MKSKCSSMILGNVISNGSYGIVYSLFNTQENKTYAYKRNLVTIATSFLGSVRELDLLTRLREHPFIVKLHQISYGSKDNPFPTLDEPRLKDDKIHFIFEHAQDDLCNYITRETVIPIKNWTTQILLGLEYMHSHGLIHRDLKPNNILIFDNQTVKIADFGISKPFTYQGAQTPRMVTAWYRAPELALDEKYDYKVDLWSLGCIIYEMEMRKPLVATQTDDNFLLLTKMITSLPPPSESFKSKYKENPTLQKLSKLDSTKHWGHILPVNETKLIALISGLLEYDPDKRLSASEALKQNFLETLDLQFLVANIREKYPPVSDKSKILEGKTSIYRSFFADEIYRISKLQFEKWINLRILFHTMEILDRYLVFKYTENEKPISSIDGHVNWILDRIECSLTLAVCLYLSVKYFNVDQLTSFLDVCKFICCPTLSLMSGHAENLEELISLKVLKGEIYRETPYEAADRIKWKLTDDESKELLKEYLYMKFEKEYTSEDIILQFYKRMNKEDKSSDKL